MQAHRERPRAASENLGGFAVGQAIPREHPQHLLIRGPETGEGGTDPIVLSYRLGQVRRIRSGSNRQRGDEGIAAPARPVVIDDLAARDGEQPAARFDRQGIEISPGGQERLGHGVFGRFWLGSGQREREYRIEVLGEHALETRAWFLAHL
jgi:hypothetical protein